jgi:lipid II:glycine glycyltransferase (peptidoglycan interpeptide bridge formation enzyme)
VKVITNVQEIDKIKWREFVKNHPDGNFFQTPEMYDIYISNVYYKPLIICICNDEDSITGILLVVIQQDFKNILGIFTKRAIIYGGPIFNNIIALESLLHKYDEIIKKEAIYSQFRNLTSQENSKAIFISLGFNYIDHLNILIDLQKPEDKLWAEIHSKRRNEIRKANKESITVELRYDIESLKMSYSILKKVYRRARIPIDNFSFLKAIFDVTDNNSGLRNFVAIFNQKIIGCMLTLVFNKTIYDFYAGSLEDFYEKHPNDIIPWEVFKWGKNNGYTLFDFGGAGKPDIPYGVRNYKIKFGGLLVNFGRYEKIHRRRIYHIVKFAFDLWQKIRI